VGLGENMGKSKIPWCDSVFNPIVGCRPISEGCKNCYARSMSIRFHDTWYGKNGKQDPLDPFAVRFLPERLEMPMSIKKPNRFFVCSMGDLFHADVKEEWILKVLTIIRAAGMSRGHKFMILTKRPGRMVGVLNSCCKHMPLPECLWLGVTAENQRWFDERVPFFDDLPKWADGKKRTFVSVEPMLEHIDIGSKNANRIGWLICGAETGIGRRNFEDEWGQDLMGECKYYEIPFFFKKDFRGQYLLGHIIPPREFPDELRSET
jgi:protein gp37